MASFKDLLKKTFQPTVYWSEQAKKTATPQSKNNNRDIIPVMPFESPRNPLSFPQAKSITLGDILPDREANRALRTSFDPIKAEKESFDRSIWAYACMELIAKSFAQIRYRVQVYEGNKWIEAPDSDLQRLLDNPNPYISRETFYKSKALMLYLKGNALESVIRVQGKPRELWPHNPDFFKPIKSRTKFVRGFEQRISGLPDKEIKYADMIHTMITDPNNFYWGRSPIKTALETIIMDNASREWNSEAMDNRAVSDGAFSVPKHLTQAQYDILKSQLRDQHQGAQNARQPWLLSNGAIWTPMDKTPVEMDFIASRQLNREEICACFSVPPTQVGIYDKATLNNFETGRRIFWEDTIVPLGESCASVFSMRLAKEFGTIERKRYRVLVDTSEVPALWKAYQERLEAAEKAKNMGYSLNDVNQRFRLGFAEQEATTEEE